MAAFSTMALAGAAAGAGGLLGGLLGRKKKTPAEGGKSLLTKLGAPGPTEPEAITPPKPPIVDPGAQQAAAILAGQKQRKRAATGSLLTMPKAPTSSSTVGARTQPRSLIGS